MAGEIPDNEDLTETFSKKPDDNDNDNDPNSTVATGLGGDDDDATTNYTKKDDKALPKLNSLSLEPIYGPPVQPPYSMRTDFEP